MSSSLCRHTHNTKQRYSSQCVLEGDILRLACPGERLPPALTELESALELPTEPIIEYAPFPSQPTRVAIGIGKIPSKYLVILEIEGVRHVMNTRSLFEAAHA